MRAYHYHGDTGTRLYRIWKSMKCRCLDSNHPSYKCYGARGISITPEWIDDYPAFREWSLSHGYDPALELDRIDVNGNYTPSNCRWITHHEQTLNRRECLYVIVNDSTMPWKEFLKTFDIKPNTAKEWRQYGLLESKVKEKRGLSIRVIRKEELTSYANHPQL